MRKQQFNWNAIFSDSQHTTRKKRYQSIENNLFIDVHQLKYAQNVITQLVQKDQTNLRAMKHITPHDQTLISVRIKSLFTHAHNVLYSIRSKAQITAFLHQLHFQSDKLIVYSQLINIVDLVISIVLHSSLSNKQRFSAIYEIKNVKQFVSKGIYQSHSVKETKNKFTSGVNAINGALSKYIATSQINAIDELKALSNNVRRQIDKQSKISPMAKNLVHYQLHRLISNATDELMSINNFVGLKRTQQHYIIKIQQIKLDKYNILGNLTNFNEFTKQAKGVIISLQISLNLKLQLEEKIDYYQNLMLNKLKQSDSVIRKQVFKDILHKEILMIIGAVSNNYQQEISNQTLNLNYSQRQNLLNHIKHATNHIMADFQITRLDIQFTKSELLKHINALQNIVQKRRVLVYNDQIDNIINTLILHIKQDLNLSNISKAYLKNQIIYFGKQMQRNGKPSKFLQIKKDFQILYRHQYKYVQRATLCRQVDVLIHQMNMSNLSNTKKQNLRGKLVAIVHNDNLNYNNKQLFIKNIQHDSLNIERTVDFKRLIKLSHAIYDEIVPLDGEALKKALNQNIYKFSQKGDNTHQIVKLDHLEQLSENNIYKILYDLNSCGNTVINNVLVGAIDRAVFTHHQIYLAILKKSLAQKINDSIDYRINIRLDMILRMHNSNKIKIQSNHIINDINLRLTNTLSNVRNTYINDINLLANDIYHRLVDLTSSSKLEALGECKANAIRQINNAEDLTHVEYFKQISIVRLNKFINQLVDINNHNQLTVRRRIHSDIHDINQQLSQINNSREVQLMTTNRILMIINRSNQCINYGLNKNYDYEYNQCHQRLNDVLKWNYLQGWNQINDNAVDLIKNLENINIKFKRRSIESINSVDLQTTNQIKNDTSTNLVKIIKVGKQRINTIIQHTIYLDPIKKLARDKLTKLSNQTKSYVHKYAQDNKQKILLSNINQINYKINEKFSTTSDRQINTIYKVNQKKFNILQLKVVQEAKSAMFNSLAQKIDRQLHDLTFLTDDENKDASNSLNLCYHKTFYNIKESPDVDYCLHNEHMGEKQIKQILVKFRSINLQKQRIYESIKSDIKNTKCQIKSLKYLRTKDRKNSYVLLAQAQQQAYQNLKQVSGYRQVFQIKNKNHIIIKRIFDEINSANVLLAAIESADDRVSSSNLNEHQKATTLQQIHQIINTGVQEQINRNNDDSHRLAKLKPYKNDALSKLNKVPGKPKPQNCIYQGTHLTSKLFSYLKEGLFSIKKFVKWIFGKLGQVL